MSGLQTPVESGKIAKVWRADSKEEVGRFILAAVLQDPQAAGDFFSLALFLDRLDRVCAYVCVG